MKNNILELSDSITGSTDQRVDEKKGGGVEQLGVGPPNPLVFHAYIQITQ